MPLRVDDPLAAYVVLHAGRTLAGLEQVGGDLTVETIHDTRTSLRRLRATLRCFPSSFEDPRTSEAGLRWMALALGEVRDADVLGELVQPELGSLPEGLSTSALREHVGQALSERRRGALESLRSLTTDPRWHRVIAQLEAWRRFPPTLPPGDHAVTLDNLRVVVQERLARSGDDPAALHSARKAGKRWRYTAELLAPPVPSAAEHLKRAEVVQDVLGTLQDEVILGEFLRELGGGPTNSKALDLLAERHRRRLLEHVARARALR